MTTATGEAGIDTGETFHRPAAGETAARPVPRRVGTVSGAYRALQRNHSKSPDQRSSKGQRDDK